MVFSSAVFLFFFLPLTFLTNRMLPGVRLKNAALILASLIFYAFGEPVYICIMLISVAVNYGLGLIAAKDGAAGKAGVWIAILFNLLMIGVFKYADFLVESLNALVDWFAGSGNTFFYIESPGISLPIGISFSHFRQCRMLLMSTGKRRSARGVSSKFFCIFHFPPVGGGANC